MKSLKISKLQITNFRNLEPDLISFEKGINCILGNNGNGKTNILEAVYYLLTRKSFRKNASFPQMLSINCEKPEIIFSAVFVDRKEEKTSSSGKVNATHSDWYIDDRPSKRKIETSAVFINPFDSYAFHNTASFRRSWFDQHISLIDKDYKRSISKYTTSLRFRNNLLSKKPNDFKKQLLSIDEQIATHSYQLTLVRLNYLEEIKDYCKQTFKEIFDTENTLVVKLDSRVIGKSDNEIFNLMQQRLEKDIAIGHTSYGVHKDDYLLLFDGLNSFDFCSLGQQKMSYLSLLFAYIELFRYKFKAFPIVLIDDVSGELDQLRWQRLITYLEKRNFQVLITTANDKFKEELEKIPGANRLYVSAGRISSL